MALRDAVQRVALEFPSYGWRRMTAELQRRGWAVNHKRVYRWMRQDNLLCLRKRKFVVTTDSDHGLQVYPNLAPEMVLTGLDQLWVSDLTYIRLELEFVYLPDARASMGVFLEKMYNPKRCTRRSATCRRQNSSADCFQTQ
jgi:putative transposase